jgi:putative membrane protein
LVRHRRGGDCRGRFLARDLRREGLALLPGYQTNGFFWAKIAAFVAVALLSIIPTIQIIRWRRALKADAAFLPAAPDIAGVRRFLWAKAAFFAFIPTFAAAMARGYGVLAH